jgi:ATP:corrinoid adenosyltransferase
MTHSTASLGVAKRSGGHIVGVIVDHGISGAQGRYRRAAIDRLLEAITAPKIDMVAAWSIERLRRSIWSASSASWRASASTCICTNSTSTPQRPPGGDVSDVRRVRRVRARLDPRARQRGVGAGRSRTTAAVGVCASAAQSAGRRRKIFRLRAWRVRPQRPGRADANP